MVKLLHLQVLVTDFKASIMHFISITYCRAHILNIKQKHEKNSFCQKVTLDLHC